MLIRLFIPPGLLLIGWIAMVLLARRNEKKVRLEWSALFEETAERIFENCKALPLVSPPSWATLSGRTPSTARMESAGVVRFVYVALFDYLPVRCWVCQKRMLERYAKYRRDDVQHFLEEKQLLLRVNWLPRPYCAECLEALGFEPYHGSRSPLKPKA